MQDSRVIPTRAFALALAAGGAGTVDDSGVPMFEFAARLGVGGGMELQARTADFGSIAGAAKLALVDASALNLSLLAGVQFARVSAGLKESRVVQTSSVTGIHATPLFGIALHPSVEIVIAPDIQFGWKSADERARSWFGVGTRVGLSLDASRTTNVLPECSLLVIPVGPNARRVYDNEGMGPGSWIDANFARGDVRFQCGVSITIGKDHAVPHAETSCSPPRAGRLGLQGASGPRCARPKF